MTTALTISSRYAPILDLLEERHLAHGHAGPVKCCVVPECVDVLELLKHPTEMKCEEHGLAYGCTECESWVPAELLDEGLERSMRSVSVACLNILKRFGGDLPEGVTYR